MRIGLALLCCLLPVSALAAGFDCGAATTPLEKTICAHAGLSALDDRLTRAFHQHLNAVSDQGREAARRGQRQWLAAVPATCPGLADSCLVELWQSRQDALVAALQKRGPWLFQRIDDYAATPQGLIHGLNWRIDQPANSLATAWNSRARHPLPSLDEACGKGTPGEVEQELRHYWANADLISASFSRMVSCDGAAHPDIQVTAETLVAEGQDWRPLRTDDLFAPQSAWKDMLIRLSGQKLRAIVQRQGEDVPFDETALAKIATDPAYWLVDDRGLGIVFPADSVAAHAFGDQEILLPWPELASILAPAGKRPR